MRKIMLSALVSTVVLAGVTLANDDLLAEATQGEVKASQSLELSKEEMKDVKGGYYQGIGYFAKSAYGLAQYFAKLTEGYQGKNVWIAGDRFGTTLNSGYSIYLTYDDPIVLANQRNYKNTSNGIGLNATAIVPNAASIKLLNTYLNTHLNILAKVPVVTR